MTDLVLSMDTMMRDLARLQFMLKGIEAECAIFGSENGRILYMSPGAEQLWGWKTAQVVGRPLTILMPNRFHRAHERGIERVAKGGMSTIESSKILFRTVPLPILTRAGREMDMLLSVAAWRSADGRLYFVASLNQPKEPPGEKETQRPGSREDSAASSRSRSSGSRSGSGSRNPGDGGSGSSGGKTRRQ